MAHIITLCRCSADPNTIDKSQYIQVIGSAEVIRPTHQINVLHPDVSINYNSNLLSANYAYIDTFDRWYFCTVSTDTAGRMTIHCSIDVLHTYRDSIRSCYGTAIRTAAGATNVPDNKLPIDPKRFFYDGKKAAVLNANTGLNYFVAINGG